MVTGGDSTRAKNISFSSSLDLDDTRGSRLTQQVMALAVDKSKPLKKAGRQKCDSKRARFESPCVHMCFLERGDSKRLLPFVL